MMASRVSSVLRSGSSSVRRRRNDADGANDDGDVENLGVRHGTIESWEYYNGWTASSQIYHYYHYITKDWVVSQFQLARLRRSVSA